MASLTILSIALSVAMILGSERVRTEARESFANSASGIDLIVAARGSSVQILMASVFGVGSTATGIDWDSYEMIDGLAQVEWAVPISMGDNHRGFPVIGTTESYFDHFKHSGGKDLIFAQGGVFSTPSGTVIGSEIAARFGYSVGMEIVNAHGAGAVSFDLHDDSPFVITGILQPTKTAVDRMVFVSLEGFDGLHAGRAADPLEVIGNDLTSGQGGQLAQAETVSRGHEPDQINAIYVGLAERLAVLSVQRHVTLYPDDALTAVLPNVALLELWSITATAEAALRLMAWAVAFAGLVGMVVMLSAALETRRREFAILRSVGVTPGKVLLLIVLEAFLLTLAGIIVGTLLGVTALLVAGPALTAQFGIQLSFATLRSGELMLAGIILCSGVLASLIPAIRVYRMTLADGLSVRL